MWLWSWASLLSKKNKNKNKNKKKRKENIKSRHTVTLMMLELRSHIGNTGFIEFLYIWIDIGLGISIIDKFQYFVLSEVTNKDIFMVVLDYSGIEVVSRWYIDSVVKEKETREVRQLVVFRIGKMFYSRSIFYKHKLILMWSFSRLGIVAVQIKRVNALRDVTNCSWVKTE